MPPLFVAMAQLIMFLVFLIMIIILAAAAVAISFYCVGLLQDLLKILRRK
jgi:hypothetical protein